MTDSTALMLGVSLGLAAGLSPGPLLILVVSESLRRGMWAGVIVSMAPLFSDLPVILLCVFLLGNLPPTHFLFVLLTFAGGFYLCWLGWQSLTKDEYNSINFTPEDSRFDESTPSDSETTGQQSRGSLAASLRQSILVNWLNPHPWLFWSIVGVPLMARQGQSQWGWSAGFLVTFYTMLVGSKLVLAVIIGTNSHRFSAAWKWRLIKVSTAGLMLVGGYLILDGIKLLFSF